MATTRDYYDILGLERGASDEEIKRSFRRLAQQWHPDVSTDPDADARFKEINEAYQVLSDPQRRQAYDLFGRAGVGGTGAGAEGYGPFGGFQGFGDIFDAFFGGTATGGATRRARRPVGADLRYDLELTFEEAIRGSEKEISFTALDRCGTCEGTGAREGTAPKTCPTCSGSGEVREVRSTLLGQMVNVAPCGRCRGTGQIVEERLPDVPRRRPGRAPADAARDGAGGHRQRPPDPPHRRGGGRAARWDARQPLRRDPRAGAPRPEARRHRALPGAAPLHHPGGPRGRDSPSSPRTARSSSRSSRAPSRAPRSAAVARACRTCVDRARVATFTSSSTSRCPTRLSPRQRDLLEQLAAEAGEIGTDGRERPASTGRTKRGKRSLGDRIKDAIN